MTTDASPQPESACDELYPLNNATLLRQYCNLSVHRGKATLGFMDGQDHPLAEMYRRMVPDAPTLARVDLDAAFVMPATGECLFFLHSPATFRFARSFGRDLKVTGRSPDGPFTLTTDEIHMMAEGEGPAGRRWAIANFMNKPAEIAYGAPRPSVRATALINNFDFNVGNEPKGAKQRDVLRVIGCGREIDFTRRPSYVELKALLEAGSISSAPLIELSFGAWPNCTDSELETFAFQVAGLVGLAAQQHTGIPLMTFWDAAGQPVRRLIVDPLRSSFRRDYALPQLAVGAGLPQLFEECFDSYGQMVKSELWGTIPSVCKTIFDPMYMEHKCANVMAGVERLMRNALVDNGVLTQEAADKQLLLGLLGAVKSKLGWDVPKHYTAKDRPRQLRNAVAHGGPFPWPSEDVARDVQKWQLFLMRRVLMQLGFSGNVRSPKWATKQWSESAVDDFTEDNNSFG